MRIYAYLVKGDSRVTFMSVEKIVSDQTRPIIVLDDIPDNYPRWAISNFSEDEANTRITDMVSNEGWELLYSPNPKLWTLMDD